MDVGGMSGTHVRRSLIVEQDENGERVEELPRIAGKRRSQGLLWSRSSGRVGSSFKAALNGGASPRFPKAGRQ
jgi:hypothetical protein